MDTLAQMRTAIQLNLTVGADSSLYSPDTIDAAINTAYRKAGGLYKWPDLNDAKKTSTEIGQEYYDIPQTWRTDSVWRLEIDSLQWGELPDGSPMDWNDYTQWRADTDNASSDTKKWSVHKRKIFVFPVPTTNGDFNISIWGQENVETLDADGDTTIFSYNMPECNEAIVLEATAILKAKGDEEQKGQFRSAEALQILTNAWNQSKSSKALYEKTTPFFEVPDLFGRGSSGGQNTGNFN